jgi:hypothetical protein
VPQLREGEYASAVTTRKAYLDLDVHIEDLKQICDAVEMDGALPEQVQQSFEALDVAIENLLGTIPPRYQYEFTSDVPGNLRVKEYYSIIVAARPKAWNLLGTQIKSEAWDKVAATPEEDPFADLRAGALYLSWALVSRSPSSLRALATNTYGVHSSTLSSVSHALTQHTHLPSLPHICSFRRMRTTRLLTPAAPMLTSTATFRSSRRRHWLWQRRRHRPTRCSSRSFCSMPRWRGCSARSRPSSCYEAPLEPGGRDGGERAHAGEGLLGS